VITTAVSWRGGIKLTVDEWRKYGTRLGAVSRTASVNWWLGDWIRFGLHRFNQRYTYISLVTGYDEQTLMNMVHVAKTFPIYRRREKLSWSHHAELAALPAIEQDLWLDRAIAEHMSVQQLRREMRRARRAGRPRRQPQNLEESAVEQNNLQTAAELFVCPRCGASFVLDGLNCWRN
jgi:hypothetical protein